MNEIENLKIVVEWSDKIIAIQDKIILTHQKYIEQLEELTKELIKKGV